MLAQKTCLSAGPVQAVDLLRRVPAGMELRPVQLCSDLCEEQTYVKVFKK